MHTSPMPVSLKDSVRSSFAAPSSRPSERSLSPGSSMEAAGVFWSDSFTWNTGAWPRLRSGLMAFTSSSNGRSWCAYAPNAVSFTRRSSVRKVGASSNRVRMASWLTKKPMRPSVSAWLRFAMSVPTTMSVCPL
ncbi:hypothetical protein COSO111634_19335 [Corallococcus soli]